MKSKNHLQNILYGVAVGDMLGVPVEFKSRDYLKQNPVNTIRGFGTHDVRAGVWSDDSSLTFCLAESINEGLDLQQLANKFIAWKNENYWTPEGEVFDIGIATSIAIDRLANGVNPELAGGIEEFDNGNGSLMRILPLVLYCKDKTIFERFQITKQVSSLTHRHIRSVIGCFYYLEFAKQIMGGKNKFEIYQNLKTEVTDFLKSLNINLSEIEIHNRLLNGNIYELREDEIKSSGYVVHTLEASIWCLLTTDNYVDAVLKAVNLGEDTDTTGAVTGGLAGMLYGFDTIPQFWIAVLPRIENINKLIYNYKKETVKIKGLITYRYVRTNIADGDECTREYPPVEHQTEATFFLPNKEGENVLAFQLQYPKYAHNLAVQYTFDPEFYSEINICTIGIFINNITFLNDNQVIFTGSFANCHTKDENYDIFHFSMYFKHENVKSFFKSSTIYADTIMDASEK